MQVFRLKAVSYRARHESKPSAFSLQPIYLRSYNKLPGNEEMSMIWSILGTIAAICTTVGFLPQLIRGIKTKELNDVSPAMLTLMLVGCSLWLAYGMHLKNLIIALANGLTLLLVIAILTLRFLYKTTNAKVAARD